MAHGAGEPNTYGAMVGEVGPTGLNTHELYNRTVYDDWKLHDVGNSRMVV